MLHISSQQQLQQVSSCKNPMELLCRFRESKALFIRSASLAFQCFHLLLVQAYSGREVQGQSCSWLSPQLSRGQSSTRLPVMLSYTVPEHSAGYFTKEKERCTQPKYPQFLELRMTKTHLLIPIMRNKTKRKLRTSLKLSDLITRIK